MRWLTGIAVLLAPLWAGERDGAVTSEVCGRCHRSIQEAWKASSHAKAMESRLFQDALEMAEADLGAAARKQCLGCHSPIAVQSGDLSLVKKVSWEGVTCDFCHSVQEVTANGPNPKAVLAFNGIKTGPLKDAVSEYHGTAYSEVHTSSLICAPCHEYKNSLGFPVLTTFSEWKAGKYAKEGRECQSCHMSRVAGAVVDPKIKRTTAGVNLHEMWGSHSLEQLNSALKATLNAARSGDDVKVTVDVSNAAAGHSLPTGSPLRQLVLEVRADGYGGEHLREERVYRRKVADQQGTEIGQEDLAFMKAAKVLSDTRLGPGEKRSEVFNFKIPGNSQVQVTAKFSYFYSPMARTESQKRITFLTLNRLVR